MCDSGLDCDSIGEGSTGEGSAVGGEVEDDDVGWSLKVFGDATVLMKALVCQG
jgi:hypothetical protein